MTRRATFRQSDLSRAAKGARAGGLNVVRAEIDHTGKIVLIFAEAESATPAKNAGDVVGDRLKRMRGHG